MTILLDIDGVLETTPSWRKPEIHEDGFIKFNDRAARCLAGIVNETGASLVLTTTHRVNYSLEQWKIFFATRGIYPSSISKINKAKSFEEIRDRRSEIINWVQEHAKEAFVVIDDDASLNDLPEIIKNKCVLTQSMIGLDDTGAKKALSILTANSI